MRRGDFAEELRGTPSEGSTRFPSPAAARGMFVLPDSRAKKDAKPSPELRVARIQTMASEGRTPASGHGRRAPRERLTWRRVDEGRSGSGRKHSA